MQLKLGFMLMSFKVQTVLAELHFLDYSYLQSVVIAQELQVTDAAPALQLGSRLLNLVVKVQPNLQMLWSFTARLVEELKLKERCTRSHFNFAVLPQHQVPCYKLNFIDEELHELVDAWQSNFTASKFLKAAIEVQAINFMQQLN